MELWTVLARGFHGNGTGGGDKWMAHAYKRMDLRLLTSGALAAAALGAISDLRDKTMALLATAAAVVFSATDNVLRTSLLRAATANGAAASMVVVVVRLFLAAGSWAGALGRPGVAPDPESNEPKWSLSLRPTSAVSKATCALRFVTKVALAAAAAGAGAALATRCWFSASVAAVAAVVSVVVAFAKAVSMFLLIWVSRETHDVRAFCFSKVFWCKRSKFGVVLRAAAEDEDEDDAAAAAVAVVLSVLTLVTGSGFFASSSSTAESGAVLGFTVAT